MVEADLAELVDDDAVAAMPAASAHVERVVCRCRETRQHRHRDPRSGIAQAIQACSVVRRRLSREIAAWSRLTGENSIRHLGERVRRCAIIDQ